VLGLRELNTGDLWAGVLDTGALAKGNQYSAGFDVSLPL
jgi:hypothetical protein